MKGLPSISRPVMALFVAIGISVVSCATRDSLEELRNEDNLVRYYEFYSLPLDSLEVTGIRNAWKKARQMSELRWTPLKDVPNNLGVFSAGIECKGVPYSSAKELDKFVGTQVSFYTFMTALRNPRSVIYTEHIGKPPYMGVNCASFYGTVCSTTVAYILGYDIVYSTQELSDQSLFSPLSNQAIEEIKPLDIILTPGHVFLINDMIVDAKTGALKKYEVLESVGTSTVVELYLPSRLKERIEENDGIIYRYNDMANNLSYDPIPYVFNEGDPISSVDWNDDLCPDRGDAACYRTDEKVTLNILTAGWKTLKLYKDGVSLMEEDVVYSNRSLSDLEYGHYRAVLIREDGAASRDIQFYVVDSSVNVSLSGSHIGVSFASANATPLYVSLVTQTGGAISKKRIAPGEDYSIIEIPSGVPNCYVKVFFKTDYGIISSKPIFVNLR